MKSADKKRVVDRLIGAYADILRQVCIEKAIAAPQMTVYVARFLDSFRAGRQAR